MVVDFWGIMWLAQKNDKDLYSVHILYVYIYIYIYIYYTYSHHMYDVFRYYQLNI